jgi:hypothetical protein
MGLIHVDVRGSFGKSNGSKTFSAVNNGHADAVAQAIEYLSGTLLPEAIALDHRLHTEGAQPSEGWRRLDDSERPDLPAQHLP